MQFTVYYQILCSENKKYPSYKKDFNFLQFNFIQI